MYTVLPSFSVIISGSKFLRTSLGNLFNFIRNLESKASIGMRQVCIGKSPNCHLSLHPR